MEFGRLFSLICASLLINMDVFALLNPTRTKFGSCYLKKHGLKYLALMISFIQDTINKDSMPSQERHQFTHPVGIKDFLKLCKYISEKEQLSLVQRQHKSSKWQINNKISQEFTPTMHTLCYQLARTCLTMVEILLCLGSEIHGAKRNGRAIGPITVRCGPIS